MSVFLPKFPAPFVSPDSTFYRGSGAPSEIEALLVEWARYEKDPIWRSSPRGVAIDLILEQWSLEQGR